MSVPNKNPVEANRTTASLRMRIRTDVEIIEISPKAEYVLQADGQVIGRVPELTPTGEEEAYARGYADGPVSSTNDSRALA